MHLCGKKALFERKFRFDYAYYVNKCLKHIKLPISIPPCTSYPKLPFDLSIMSEYWIYCVRDLGKPQNITFLRLLLVVGVCDPLKESRGPHGGPRIKGVAFPVVPECYGPLGTS